MTTFNYDPQRQGYDETLWKTLTGTPAVTSDVLRFTSAEAIHYGDITKGDVTFNLIVPDDPESGDARRWGLYAANKDLFVGFEIIDDEFFLTVGDEAVEVAWDTDWAAADTEYRIVWEAGMVKFYIDEVQVGVISESLVAASLVSIPHGPLSVYVENATADNLDVVNIQVEAREYVSNQLVAVPT